MPTRSHIEPKALIVIAFFFTGIFLGAFGVFSWLSSGRALLGIQKIHSSGTGYRFINPLLAVDEPGGNVFLENKLLESRAKKIIEGRKISGEIEEGAVYFRDLEPGRWMGWNETLKFSPGLLLKIPIMIAYLKAAQDDPAVLDQRLRLKNNSNDSVGDLLNTMIVLDDDHAAEALFDHIDKEALNESYNDLGIDFREDKSVQDFLSLRSYGLFFRVLYNATYLHRDMSEKALGILNETSKLEGIAAGLPNNLMVAHKYHTRTFLKNDVKLIESHDCGIVYLPQHPYLACMMGIAKQQSAVDKLFRELGQVLYTDMVEHYPQ